MDSEPFLLAATLYLFYGVAVRITHPVTKHPEALVSLIFMRRLLLLFISLAGNHCLSSLRMTSVSWWELLRHMVVYLGEADRASSMYSFSLQAALL